MDFDTIINRKGTYCTQWDYIKDRFGVNDLLPFTISDMDLASPDEIIESLINRVNHKIFGYSRWNHDDFKNSIELWYKKRFNFDINKDDIVYSPSVIYAVSNFIRMKSNINDNVLILTPAYDGFFKTIKANNRNIISSSLKKSDSKYEVDFNDFEEKCKISKVFVFCSPHNPVGKVWDIEELKKDLSSGELDLAFANFNKNGLNIDTILTTNLFEEKYVVLSTEPFAINSIKGLKDKEVITVKNTYINDYLNTNSIKNTGYNNTDDLLRNIKNKSIVVIDKATYDYYKTRKFSDFKVIYEGVLPYNYSFMIRDVNKNKIFSEMFTYYTSSVNYDTIKYKDNTNSKIYEFSLLTTFLLAILVILIIIFLIFFIKKKKENSTIVTNNDKLKYIDTMTSLKNRAYLNLKIKEWDDNVIYPQAFVIIDLNNIKDINDSHGHEEGDTIIKKAASTLIVNQEPNTDIIRTDGNEFLVYMVGYSEKDVISYTRKIYKELKELPYGYGAAIGYSMIMDDIKTVDDAINEATIDMRNKKENNNG